jgi:hypothetical protein
MNKLLLLLALVLFSCQSSKKEPAAEKKWSDLPAATKLDSLTQTEFAATLENPLTAGKNVVYAPTLLFAWDKVRELLKSQVIIDSNSSLDFLLLNASTTHQRALTDSEYEVTGAIEGKAIIAKAFFNKTLPFDVKMQAAESPMAFGDAQVQAFGMYYYDEDVARNAEIMYYKDNDHFVLKLHPKDKQHEIILAKGLGEYHNALADGLRMTDAWIQQGKKEKADPDQQWKYSFGHDDLFSIPAFKFNIETNYKKLEGENFATADHGQHFIQTAWQRTALILDENGAVVESEAVIVVDSAGARMPDEHPLKHLVFDKPFLVVIKRVEQANPYFVMKVENGELMKRK